MSWISISQAGANCSAPDWWGTSILISTSWFACKHRQGTWPVEQSAQKGSLSLKGISVITPKEMQQQIWIMGSEGVLSSSSFPFLACFTWIFVLQTKALWRGWRNQRFKWYQLYFSPKLDPFLIVSLRHPALCRLKQCWDFWMEFLSKRFSSQVFKLKLINEFNLILCLCSSEVNEN